MSQFVPARCSHSPARPCLCPPGPPPRGAGPPGGRGAAGRRRRRKVPPSSTSFRGRGQPAGPASRQERESERQRDRERERDGGGAGGSALRGTRLPPRYPRPPHGAGARLPPPSLPPSSVLRRAGEEGEPPASRQGCPLSSSLSSRGGGEAGCRGGSALEAWRCSSVISVNFL